MRERPVIPFALSLLGGLYIATAAVLVDVFTFDVFGLLLGLLGLGFGASVVYNACMLYLHPRERVSRGIVIVVLSLLSLVTAVGGFYVGLILGVIGGALAIRWEPPRVPYFVPPPAFQRRDVTRAAFPPVEAGTETASAREQGKRPPSGLALPASFCVNCGVALPEGAASCPACGARLDP